MSASQPNVISIRDLLNKSGSYLKEKGSATPRLDAELLLAEVLGLSRVELYTNYELPLNRKEVDAFRELIRRRGQGEPVAYILGRTYFRNLTLQVSPAVLIPRPETEHLVEEALNLLEVRDWGGRAPEVLDLGTGSGAIAVSIASGFTIARVTAADISGEALEIAAENARIAGVEGRIGFIQSDLFDELDPTHTFDIIMCNPPYISAAEWPELPVDVREYEPRGALYGGEDGLDYYRRLAIEAPQFLRPAGCLILEIGYKQGLTVAALLDDAGCFETVDVKKDYAGHDRVAVACRKLMREI